MLISELLDVIETDKPAGANLRLVAGDLTFDNIAEMRRVADSETSAGGETKNANWDGVRRECETCLRDRTKDLEIAAFLTEAFCYIDGWSGLAAGLQLVKGLLEGFWDLLHPGWDEGEIILPIRARPVSWLGSSREFLLAVKQIPITAALGQNPLSWFDYEQSKRVDEASLKTDQTAYEELVEAGLVSGAQWQTAINTTPSDHLAAVRTAIEDCAATVQDLYHVCEDKFGDDAPYLQDLSSLLEDCTSQLSQFSGEPAADVAPVATGGDEGMTAQEPAMSPARPQPVEQQATGPITSREQAYRHLKEAADFLRRTEPHSPVPVLVERAIVWGQMPFEDLFKDVVKDESTQCQVMEMLGLRANDQD